MKTPVALLAAVLLTACAHHGDSEHDRSAEQALNHWTKAIASRDTEKVLALYDDDAVLLATFAKQPITSQEGRRAYFNELLKKKNLKVTIDKLYTERDGDIALANGLYTFSYTQGGKTVKVPARFSFVFEEEEEGWEIEAHHSSLQPKK
jgi:uncharacterized protein (TIGR02246 family)